MTDNDEQPGVYESSATRRHSLRRKQAAVGVVGLAAVLGAGAYLVTAHLTDRKTTVTTDPGALAPLTPAVSAEPSASASASAATPKPTLSTKNAVKQSYTASPVPTQSLTVEEQIQAAREAAARDGHPVQRALTAAPGVAALGVADTRREERPNGSLEIYTAPFDLSGQTPVLWAAGGTWTVGRATCTQTVRFANNSEAKVRPTMMLCWRTSAQRSVATVLVDMKNKPSAAESARIIDREWARLG
jgi:hypothetical protein